MAKKTLARLHRELDFPFEQGYFNYIVESYINGNFSQVKELFTAMRKDDAKKFLNYCVGMGEFETKTREYCINLL